MNDVIIELEHGTGNETGQFLINLNFNHFHSGIVGTITQASLKKLENDLVTSLTDYERSPSQSRLKVLIEKGREAYNEFRSQFVRDENIRYAQMWDERFEKLPLKSNIGFEYVKKVGCVFPKGFSFPFSLLYLRNPDLVDWNNENTNEIFDYFLGMRFRLYYKTAVTQPNPREFLKDNPAAKTQVIHAIDNSLKPKREERSWALDKSIDYDPKVYNKKDLLNEWLAKGNSHIVHFSNHLDYDRKDKSKRVLTLSGSDVLKKSDFGLTPSLKKKPLVFLNNCKSSVNHFDYDDPFLTKIFPRYALGFIATLFKVKNGNAGEFAYQFYKYFFNGYSVSDSLYKARDYVTGSDIDFFASIGYVIWELHPDTMLSRKVEERKKNHKTK